jgi:hypothetical protein
MTIPYIKSGGWAYKEKLTSAQMNTLQTTLVERCADVQGTTDITSTATWYFRNVPIFIDGLRQDGGVADFTGGGGSSHKIIMGSDEDRNYNNVTAAYIMVPLLSANRVWTLTVNDDTTDGCWVWVTHTYPYGESEPNIYYVDVQRVDTTSLGTYGGGGNYIAGLFVYLASYGGWIPIIRTTTV